MKEHTDGKSTAAGAHKLKHQQLAKRYLDGDNLVEIARAADIPPCTLLRIVLPHLTTLDKYSAQRNQQSFAPSALRFPAWPRLPPCCAGLTS